MNGSNYLRLESLPMGSCVILRYVIYSSSSPPDPLQSNLFQDSSPLLIFIVLPLPFLFLFFKFFRFRLPSLSDVYTSTSILSRARYANVANHMEISGPEQKVDKVVAVDKMAARR